MSVRRWFRSTGLELGGLARGINAVRDDEGPELPNGLASSLPVADELQPVGIVFDYHISQAPLPNQTAFAGSLIQAAGGAGVHSVVRFVNRSRKGVWLVTFETLIPASTFYYLDGTVPTGYAAAASSAVFTHNGPVARSSLERGTTLTAPDQTRPSFAPATISLGQRFVHHPVFLPPGQDAYLINGAGNTALSSTVRGYEIP